jgi:hypothetical protein
VLPLTFGDPEEIANVVETMRKHFSLPDAPVVVLGSDLVYFESLFVPLAQTMREFAWKFDADIYLAYKKRIYKNEKRFFHKILAQHSLDFDVALQATVHEVDPASQHADGRVVDDQAVAEEDDWNTRILRIKKAKVWRESASGTSAAPTVTGESNPLVTSASTCEKNQKGKKNKVPCSKEKRGRIR